MCCQRPAFFAHLPHLGLLHRFHLQRQAPVDHREEPTLVAFSVTVKRFCNVDTYVLRTNFNKMRPVDERR